MELATAAKRLAAVVYPMGSGSVRRCKARYGQVGLGAVWYGASSGRPVGDSWSSSRCGAAGLGCGLAGRGLVRHGLVRGCYAAFSRLIQSADRCVSIKWARRGLEWHGGAGHGEVRPILGEKNG